MPLLPLERGGREKEGRRHDPGARETRGGHRLRVSQSGHLLRVSRRRTDPELADHRIRDKIRTAQERSLRPRRLPLAGHDLLHDERRTLQVPNRRKDLDLHLARRPRGTAQPQPHLHRRQQPGRHRRLDQAIFGLPGRPGASAVQTRSADDDDPLVDGVRHPGHRSIPRTGSSRNFPAASLSDRLREALVGQDRLHGRGVPRLLPKEPRVHPRAQL